ncbi:MAG: 4-hydroxybenzoate octaprenyltransferase [Pseudomonadota bacterium]|nr:4-hydroxybenzoate octaprenyltransferase [Pseudomonadota bacterium]
MTSQPSPRSRHASVADAVPGNWVDAWAPEFARPYLRLARADRPIGVWLLLLPCWWSTALAGLAQGRMFPDIRHLLLFAVGAIVMRAAGCAYNDIVDREFDGKVARTRSRPIPSGQISVRGAQAFMLVMCVSGLLVLLQFNNFAILLGMGSLAVVAVYPFMKRYTDWPQAVLGLAFSWGALMGWAAAYGRLDAPAMLLYAGAFFWTVGYDTIYAHQDKEDDALLGLKSTALKFGARTRLWLSAFYALTALLLLLAGFAAGAGIVFVCGLALGAGNLTWQVATLDTGDSINCLKRFRSNRDFGLIVFASLAADMAIRALV